MVCFLILGNLMILIYLIQQKVSQVTYAQRLSVRLSSIVSPFQRDHPGRLDPGRDGAHPGLGAG